jgi:hypothetical protein
MEDEPQEVDESWEYEPHFDASPEDEEWLTEQGPDREDRIDARGPALLPELLPAGYVPRGEGEGMGFAAGGVLDTLPPGAVLAGFAGDAWSDGLGRLTDDELIGVLGAWRRMASWATAAELAAVSELTDRRQRAAGADDDGGNAAHLNDEIAAALTLTGRAADLLLEFACGLARLPRTAAALACGDIDRAQAKVIVDEVAGLDDGLARAVEEKIIGRAPALTTGQLRAATRRAVLSADPEAAGRTREKARKDARVEAWSERAGTAALAGRDLPPADVLAADKRIDAMARHLKASGADQTMDQLRARVYTALLLGQPFESLLPGLGQRPGQGEHGGVPAGLSGTGGPSAAQTGPALRGAGLTGTGPFGMSLAGSVNLTMPLATWLGGSNEPGEAAGFGPLSAADSRALADALAGRNQPGTGAGSPIRTRWCITLTDNAGRAVGHGCASAAPPRDGETGWSFTVKITKIASGSCEHERACRGYVPSPSLRHLIEIRQRTCSFPGCRRAATRCDKDHTLAYDKGGLTCECNLSPLCRRHHRAKQAGGWRLEQLEPGFLTWTMPHGRKYRTAPQPYP